jgi:hypothetical protein
MAGAVLRLNFWPSAAIGLWLLALPASPGFAACRVPAEAFLFEPLLPQMVATLSAGRPIKVVAIGSASTDGRAAGGPEFAWPQQFKISLSQMFPAASISVVNLAKPRLTAADMVKRFEKEIIPLAPALVIWQTGTVDAVDGIDLADFRATLQSGLNRLRAVSEVVVMDPQFSRRTRAMIDFEPYESVMREVADANDVPMFPRSDLMRAWSEAGEFNYSVADKDERREMARRLYACIGNALAAFVTRRAPAQGSGR